MATKAIKNPKKKTVKSMENLVKRLEARNKKAAEKKAAKAKVETLVKKAQTLRAKK